MLNTDKELVMRFDPNTIQHLGISLYSKLPTVLAELVSNSWDADASKISINFINANQDKQIIYTDDGNGMNFNELNDKFLLIGRNRRDNTDDKITPNKNRKVIGKKGLGKLAVFGIAKTIQIITVKENIKNEFIMDLDEILSSKEGGYYNPKIVSFNEKVNENNYTKIVLSNIERKSPFDTKNIAENLCRKFLIFDENFKVILYYNNGNPILLTNEMKFDSMVEEFTWEFPNSELGVIILIIIMLREKYLLLKLQ